MTRRRLLSAALLLAVAACSSGEQGLVLVAGKPIDPKSVDGDPTSALPTQLILLGYIDASALFATNLGDDVARFVTSLVPLGPEAKFDPRRDVKRVYGGVYSMQGADFVCVVQGNFDRQAVEAAAANKAVTAFGAPLVRSRYDEVDLYTARNIGFALLTDHTALAGNETGMRRALDRLRYGKRRRELQPWMVDLVNTKGASFALAGDFTREAPAEATVKSLGFLSNLQRVRVIGNFKPPGVNVAGALSYPDPASAAQGAQEVQHLQAIATVANLFTSFGGVQIPEVQTETRQNDVGFTSSVSDGSARALLAWLGQMMQSAR